jgi:hypothetical protein
MTIWFKSRSFKRFIGVLIISLLGFCFSFFYLKPKESTFQMSFKKNETAVILKTLNEVNRQMLNQLTWETIENGAILHKGDKIKTNKNSSTVIQFIKNKTILNIESDSIVIIDQNDENIELKLLTGNLFVKQSSKEEKVQIYSGEKGTEKLELINAEASITATKNGKATIDIIKGSATNNGEAVKITANIFGEINPNYGEVLYKTKHENNMVDLRWSPLDENYSVAVEAGDSRESLKTIEINRTESLKGLAQIKKGIGTTYWRLKATNKKSNEIITSSVLKFSVENLQPPVLIYPENSSSIRYVEGENENIEFKWHLPTSLQNIKIQIAKNESFNEIFLEDVVTKQTFYESNKMKEEGKYYWKVYGNTPGTNELTSSNTYSFNLIKGKAIFPPTLISPTNSYIEFLAKENRGNSSVNLNWKSESLANSYLITLKNGNVKKEMNTTMNSQVLTDLKNGQYSWYIQSIDEFGKKSVPSETRVFTVAEIENIKLQKNIGDVVQYISKIPQVEFKWQQIKNATHYVFYSSLSLQFLNKIKLETTNGQVSLELMGKGINYFYLEALDKNLQVIARSNNVQVLVKEKDLPLPPRFTKASNSPLMSNLDGRIEIIFVNILKNEKIMAELKDSNNNVIEKSTVEQNRIEFSDLRPGQYFIQAKLIDEDGRISDYSEKRSIFVPEKSSVKTPKIKNIKIK